MKRAALAAAVVFLLLGLSQAYAQEPAPPPPVALDLGETDILQLACGVAVDKAQAEGLSVRYCRRHEQVVEGTRASVTVAISIPGTGKFLVRVDFRKSLWWSTGFSVTPG